MNSALGLNRKVPFPGFLTLFGIALKYLLSGINKNFGAILVRRTEVQKTIKFLRFVFMLQRGRARSA